MKPSHIPLYEQRSLPADIAKAIDRFSFTKLARHALAQEAPDGAEGAVAHYFGDQRGTQHQEGRTDIIPWGVATRDLTAANFTGGGALVGHSAPGLTDFLKNYNVLARAGAQIINAQAANMTVPGVIEPVELTWLGTEAAVRTDSQPLIGATTVTPHIASASFNVSGKLLRQAPSGLLDKILTRHLLVAAGQAVDRGALQGRLSGNMAEPVGLCALPSLEKYTYSGWTGQGSSISDALADAMQFVVSRTGDDSRCQFVMSALARKHLTPDSDRGVPPFDGDAASSFMYARRAHCTRAAPGTQTIYGDWSTAMLVLFGPGVEVAIDPFTRFKFDQITVRVMVAMDVAFPCAANAFAVTEYEAPAP